MKAKIDDDVSNYSKEFIWNSKPKEEKSKETKIEYSKKFENPFTNNLNNNKESSGIYNSEEVKNITNKIRFINKEKLNHNYKQELKNLRDAINEILK